jgi:hypothetical protein
LGLDASTNRYFCKKTVRDIKCMLEYCANFSTGAEISGDFKLVEVSRVKIIHFKNCIWNTFVLP